MGLQPLLAMQCACGLARAGFPEADQMPANLEEFVGTAPAFSRESWQDAARPACICLPGHARGDRGAVVRTLGPVRPRSIEIGGSHAQRDVFETIMLDGAIRTGRHSTGRRTLEMRRRFEPLSAPGNMALAAVCRNLGLDRKAVQALSPISP